MKYFISHTTQDVVTHLLMTVEPHSSLCGIALLSFYDQAKKCLRKSLHDFQNTILSPAVSLVQNPYLLHFAYHKLSLKLN